jgi:beta-glucosidase
LRVAGVVSASSNATVSFTVTNTGNVKGAEVWQCYVGGALPGDPPRALKGFAYTGELEAGQAVSVALPLTVQLLSLWSVERHAFVSYPQGVYEVVVGASSRDVRLAGSVRVTA